MTGGAFTFLGGGALISLAIYSVLGSCGIQTLDNGTVMYSTEAEALHSAGLENTTKTESAEQRCKTMNLSAEM